MENQLTFMPSDVIDSEDDEENSEEMVSFKKYKQAQNMISKQKIMIS